MVLVKIRYFFIVLSLGKTGRENVWSEVVQKFWLYLDICIIIHLEDFTGDENIVFDFLDVCRLGQSRYFV